MNKVYSSPKTLVDVPMHYCPGCTHGIIHRLVAEVVEEMGFMSKTIGIASVGCSCFCYDYFNFDMVATAHGRAPATATGVKRVHPDCLVFTYQGDGDLAAIGTAEIIHSAVRGEKISVIFVNNGIYGMTGGQMAPTTLPEMKATTSPYGRNTALTGYPIKMTEMLALQDGCVYAERTKISSIATINRTKKAIRKSFELQMAGKGFSVVEILSTCPTNWGIEPLKAIKWMEDNLEAYYPVGVIKAPKEVE
ncbi:MAG: 2-oxoglutarate/2-oxoacid ferredoxin oxidoreductase subunit beta [Clostridia bacterium]|nr:2-oxoglutarate/2-oxoacid ferredoxin oxidoreductase subunit beta [Clostridia bacterium]MDN5321691.1 2-oxoglutarate/2-oxoacid ferredoxin oxidoreductase subunit beta [Clostridia bacterium]